MSQLKQNTSAPLDISWSDKNIWRLPWDRVESASMVSPRNMENNGHNEANEGPYPMVIIAKLQKKLVEMR